MNLCKQNRKRNYFQKKLLCYLTFTVAFAMNLCKQHWKRRCIFIVFTHTPDNINISRKSTFFEITFRNCFVALSPKKIKIQEIYTFLQNALKKYFFVYMSKNINISRKVRFFLDRFVKIVFLSISPKMSKFQER